MDGSSRDSGIILLSDSSGWMEVLEDLASGMNKSWMFLSPFLMNMIMDLSSTSRMIFLFLQKCWINTLRDSPFFCTTWARSHSTYVACM
jgi:hypothetical protein